MPKIQIVVSYKHQVGKLKELQEWLANSGAAMLASTWGSKESYVGVYMIEGDPTYSIEVRTETDDPNVIEELDKLNTEGFNRGKTAQTLMIRFIDQSVPPRIHFSRPLHEAAPRTR